MPASSRILVAICAAAAAAAALTACGGDDTEDSSAPMLVPAATTSAAASTAPAAAGEDDPYSSMTAPGLLATAESDMLGLKAMTMSVNTVQDGATMQVKAAMTAGGKCAATMRISGEDIHLIITDATHTYLKADPDFWRATGGSKGDKVAATIAGRWVKLSPEVLARGNMNQFCTIHGLVDGMLLANAAGEDDEVVKGAPTTLDGRTVIPLTQKLGGESDTMYVSTGSTPYIVKFEIKSDDAPGGGTFTDFGKVPHIAPPPASQVVNMTSLGIDPGNGGFSV